MSQISPSGEGIDPVIEPGDHQYASLGERLARLENDFQYLAKEASVDLLRSEMTGEIKQLRTEMERFATKDDMSKEIHKARNWILAAMSGVFAMLATQQLQLWALMQ